MSPRSPTRSGSTNSPSPADPVAGRIRSPARRSSAIGSCAAPPWSRSHRSTRKGLDWFAGQTPGNVTEGELALEGEAALRVKLEADARTILDLIASGATNTLPDDYQLSESDRAQQAKDSAVLAENLPDALRNGVDGWVDDDLAFVAPWGFDVASIAVPTSLWYGRADTLVPAAHGDWLAARIPNVAGVRERGRPFRRGRRR